MNNPRVLIAILSCVLHAKNGYNQIMRDTWLKNTTGFSNLSYKFFLGSGESTGEDETALKHSWSQAGFFKRKEVSDPPITSHALQNDEIALRIPDGYMYASYKLRESCRWALSNNFDFIFQCLTDTYVVPSRLLASGFEKFDYLGTANNERTALGGGPGFWLSEKSMRFITDAPVNRWNYDGWVGDILRENKVELQHDSRYTNFGLDVSPLKDNDAITSHIANSPTVYDPSQMIQLHQQYEGSL
jgi:hypothetical protein